MNRFIPRVFISYSDDSSAHAKRVLELAQWLRSQGIDARVDQFEHSPEVGWPRWIYTQIREADFVLVVCTRAYLRRCEGDVPREPGTGKAVKFESHLSLQEIHDADGRNRKFVPIVLDEADVGECVPLPLRGATHYRLPAQREELYRRLSDQPRVRAAPLGRLRRPEPSLETVITVDPELASARRRRRRTGWFSGQARRLLAAGAFGVAFLATVLVLDAAVSTPELPGSPLQRSCSIQLTEPGGGTVDDIDRVLLELPAGQEIEVTVDNGDTLRFACPEVAVRGRMHVYRNISVAESDPALADAPAAIETEVELSPEPGLHKIELPPPELADIAPIPEDGPAPIPDVGDGERTADVEPTPELEIEAPEYATKDKLKKSPRRREPEPGSSASLGPLDSPEVEVDEKRSAPALAEVANRELKDLRECHARMYERMPKLGGELTCAVEYDGDGTVGEVRVGGVLAKRDPELARCVRAAIEGWTIRGDGDETGDQKSVPQLTLRFGRTGS